MTMKLFFSTLLLSTVILFSAVGAVAFSQRLPDASRQAVSPSPAAPTPRATKVNVRTSQAFEGTIQKAGDQLVLRDLSTQQSYQVDDQDAVERYKGQYVKVIATLDAHTNTLHLMDVVPESGTK